MNEDLFDYRHQLRRELNTRWRLRHRGNTAVGTLVVLTAFYLLHWPGYSQVYDVIPPYFVAAAYLALMVMSQTYGERIHPSATFFKGLPRSRSAIVDANALYFLGHALYYQMVIAIGVLLKLGGADITPVYRLHPTVMVLPFAAVFITLWLYNRHSYWDTSLRLYLIGVVVVAALVVENLLIGTGGPDNNFMPPRLIPLGVSIAIALLMVWGTGALLWRERSPRWAGVEV